MKKILVAIFGSLVLFFLIFLNVYANSSPFKESGGCSIVSKYTVSVAVKQVGKRIVIEPKTLCYLVGKNDMTLYYLQGETPDHLICKSNECLQEWPIFYSKNILIPRCLNIKDFTTLERNNGEMQTVYDNHPLYYFAGDKKPGDTLGDDLKTPFGVWHIVITAPEK